jgi:aspartyl-tRNA(Asn)/glutamyl-tRNA(Gln) amidotransferase subunit B
VHLEEDVAKLWHQGAYSLIDVNRSGLPLIEIVREMRDWVEEQGMAVSMRTKEYTEDFRYLPEARRDRFMTQYGLSLYDTNILTSSRTMADYFENCVKLMYSGKTKIASNWFSGDFSQLLNATNTEIENAKISPKHLTEMLDLVDNGTISRPTAKMVLEDMFHTGKRASEIITEKRLSQISDADEIREAVKQVMVNNSEAVADYSSGKQQALTFIIGQVMRATKGRANPGMVREITIQELGGK